MADQIRLIDGFEGDGTSLVGLSSNGENASFGVESAWSHLRFS